MGKAKDLHKRVAQYFVSPDRLNAKTRILVSKIADAQYSVVDSEADALLLENNLIKQYKPKYNILLKDSKTYPWICVTSDEFPKIYLTRRIVKGNRYFGPYSSVIHARNLLEFISENYKIRSCNNKITSDGVLRGKFRPCLDFHISRCAGCCIGKISVKEYNAEIEEIVSLLKGGANEVIQHYRHLMTQAADNLEFEQAQVYKQKVDSLQQHYSKSVITSASDTNVDVFSLVTDANESYGNFMRVRGGAIIQSLNLGFKMNIEEEPAAVLSEFIAEIESKFGKISGEVIVPFMPDVEMEGVSFKIPVKGDKLAILTLSTKNAKEFQFNSIRQKEHTDPDQYKSMVMEELRKALGMDVLPRHIECFDNSNISGSDAVAGCVVFKGMRPAKKDYRKYNIKTVVGPDDYASMQEVVRRRYQRMTDEHQPLPDLIITDGGKGQMDVVSAVVNGEMGLNIAVAGLAKDDRHRTNELLFGDPICTVALDVKSELFHALTRIQDEVHRYAITFHRDKRSKHALHSELDDITGIGTKTRDALLKAFKSVKRIKGATLEQLATAIGPSKANTVYRHFQEATNAPQGKE